MRIRVLLSFLVLLASPPLMAKDKAPDNCAPDGNVKFICGIAAPEDLEPLPGGKWIVTSGLTTNSGLHLVNLKTKAAERWLPAAAKTDAAVLGDRACTTPPVADEMQAHGISVRDRGDGHATIYVVNHGGGKSFHFIEGYPTREAIEIFDADMHGAKPTLTWAGCAPVPLGLMANSVTSTADGTIYLTVVLHPGMTSADYIANRPTGAVYRRRPGDAGFTRIWGSEFTGDNGLEASADGKTLYIVAKDGLRVISNTNPATLLEHVTLEGIGDNVHWSDGKLIVAGVKHRADPACADLFKAAAGQLGEKCTPGYFAVAVDPVTFKVMQLTSGAGSKVMNGVTGGITTRGKTLWLTSLNANRIAYLKLP
jgi:hypothetical protein